ncbi:MAG: methyltransferase [Chitinophagales bacterium]
MSAKPFHFKQFIIHQDKCAMKVGTDGVLLGAWAPTESATTILDIGTGTGVIAIMQAQRNNVANIVGIEIDKGAAHQATFNCSECNWSNRLNILNISLQDFAKTYSNKFDHIICNPPFYPNEHFTKAGGTNERVMARNSDTLNYEDLMKCARQLLQEAGELSIVVPVSVEQQVIEYAFHNKLYLAKRTYVQPLINKKALRALLNFSTSKVDLIENSITIQKGKRNEFTDEYIELTKAFYTIL